MARFPKIEHAAHNKEVCEFLSDKIEYLDWVITTAFYSAIHYIDHKIFPIKVKKSNGGKYTIKTIDEYRNLYPKNIDKHSYRATLVNDRCPEISGSFNWLRSTCSTARYTDYKFKDPEIVLEITKKHLEEIVEYCE
ncbi:MAG: hypothetical protein QM530_04540 [Phycisphaerales bacterium]|nr:hypothetical protein [Phycisphaerales bacterium]